MLSPGAPKKREWKLERDSRGRWVGFLQHLVQMVLKLCQSRKLQERKLLTLQSRVNPESARHCCVQVRWDTDAVPLHCALLWNLPILYRTSLRCSFSGMGRKELALVQKVSFGRLLLLLAWTEYDKDLLPLYLRLAAPMDLGALWAEAACLIGCLTWADACLACTA